MEGSPVQKGNTTAGQASSSDITSSFVPARPSAEPPSFKSPRPANNGVTSEVSKTVATDSSSSSSSTNASTFSSSGNSSFFFQQARSLGSSLFNTTKDAIAEKIDEVKDVGTFVAGEFKLSSKEETDRYTKLFDDLSKLTLDVDDEEVRNKGLELKEQRTNADKLVETTVARFLGVAIEKAGDLAVFAVKEFVPYGGVLISMGSYVIEGLRSMKDNKELADEIITIIEKDLIERIPLWSEHFKEGAGDERGIECCHKLLLVMVKAKRTIDKIIEAAPNPKSMVSKALTFVVHFVTATDNAGDLMTIKVKLFELAHSILIHENKFLDKKLNVVESRQNEQEYRLKELEKNSSSAEEGYLLPLKSLNSFDDAVDFWTNNDFRNKEPSTIVVEQLLFAVVDADISDVIDRKMLRDVEKLPFFIDLKNRLDTGRDEYIEPKEFKSFLQKYQPNIKDCKCHVADAVKEYLGGKQWTSSSSSPPPPTGDAAVSATAGNDGDYILNRMEALIKPTAQGDDKVKHSNSYLEGTRSWLFDKVRAWITSKEPKIERAFWVDGTGGLGKSIIAAKLVDIASEENSWLSIGAYFFCKHDDDRRNNPHQVVATLAFQLSKNIPEVATYFSKLDPNRLSDLCSGVTGNFEEVFEALISLPLHEAATSWPSSKRMCILLDALDEIRLGPGRTQLLKLVGKGLLSLPEQVFMIVTSRPDPDIVMHLKLVKPLKIDRMEERQMDDLRMYARRKIITETSLNLLSSEKEKEEVLDILTGRPNVIRKDASEKLDLGKSDGVFLALRYISEHLKKVGKNRNLRLEDVIDLPSNMVDSTYLESLKRIDERIKAMNGSKALKNNAKTYINTVLATLVISRQPLNVEELCNFCGGSAGEMDQSLVMEVLNSFSLLFSFSKNRPIEPLHKSVFDFLLDRARSGEFAVDVRLGHMTMALSCARTLNEGVFRSGAEEGAGKSLFEDVDRICDGGMERSSLYALKFGQVHLSHTIMALLDGINKVTGQVDAKKSREIDGIIKVWEGLLLTRRILADVKQSSSNKKQVDARFEAVDGKIKHYLDITSPEGKKTRFYKSNMMAKECCLKWILLQAKLGRNYRFTVELEALKEAMSKLPCMNKRYRNEFGGDDASEDGGSDSGASTMNNSDAMRSTRSFDTFLSTTIWLLGSFFNSEWETRKNEEGSLKETAAVVFQNVPATSEWFGSPAMVVFPCKMTLPLRVGISQLKRTLSGHSKCVSSVAFSSDGSRIVSGSDDKTMKVWDAVTGEVIQTFIGHTSSVYSVAFSSDGLKVVSGSFDEAVKVWDAVTGELAHTLNGHSSDVKSVAFNSDGSRIVSGSGDKTVKMWDAVKGEVIKTLHGHTGIICSVAFSSDGLKIVSGSSDKTVKIWDAVTGELMQTLNLMSSDVSSVAFSGDWSKIVSGSFDKTVKVWDAVTGELMHTLNGHSSDVKSVAFSRIGSEIASRSSDGIVKVWDAMTGELIQTLNHHSAINRLGLRLFDYLDKLEGFCFDNAIAVAFNSDGSKIVSGSINNTVKVWDALPGEVIHTLNGHSSDVYSVAFNSDGSRIVSGSEDKTVKVWDAVTGEVIKTLNGHTGSVYTVAFNSDGSKIVSGSEDKTVKVWDAVTGEMIQTLNGHTGFVYTVAFSSDGLKIVSCSEDKTVKAWDAVTGEVFHTLFGHTSSVKSVAFSSDGLKIVSGSKDKTVKAWDAVTGEVVHTFNDHSSDSSYGESMFRNCVDALNRVNTVAFNSDGSKIVSGSGGAAVKVWDAVTGEVIHTLKGHCCGMNTVAFSSDGSKVVSDSSDKTVKVWDAVTGEVFLTLNGHLKLVNSVAFSSDMSSIVSGSSDGTVKVWEGMCRIAGMGPM